MLASAILINLVGIMFDSARFQGENLRYYQGEYDSLAYAIIVLIFVSIVYWAVTLAFDIFAVSNPLAAMHCFASVTNRGNAAAKLLRKAAEAGASRLSFVGGKSTDANGNETPDAQAAASVSSPRLLKATTIRATAGSSGAASLRPGSTASTARRCRYR